MFADVLLYAHQGDKNLLIDRYDGRYSLQRIREERRGEKRVTGQVPNEHLALVNTMTRTHDDTACITITPLRTPLRTLEAYWKKRSCLSSRKNLPRSVAQVVAWWRREPTARNSNEKKTTPQQHKQPQSTNLLPQQTHRKQHTMNNYQHQQHPLTT